MPRFPNTVVGELVVARAANSFLIGLSMTVVTRGICTTSRAVLASEKQVVSPVAHPRRLTTIAQSPSTSKHAKTPTSEFPLTGDIASSLFLGLDHSANQPPLVLRSVGVLYISSRTCL